MIRKYHQILKQNYMKNICFWELYIFQNTYTNKHIVPTFVSAKALITFPRAKSDRLIFVPSINRVLCAGSTGSSDPARSMSVILAIRTF